MTAAARAWELRARLFALVAEFKEFSLAVHTADATPDATPDARDEAHAQADAVACELARLHRSLSGPSPEYDLFTDAARDPKDRAFDFRLGRAAPAADFAARLRGLRERAGLTVQGLAEAAGVTRQAVHNYEAGDRRPTWGAVQALAAALGVTTDEFRDEG